MGAVFPIFAFDRKMYVQCHKNTFRYNAVLTLFNKKVNILTKIKIEVCTTCKCFGVGLN